MSAIYLAPLPEQFRVHAPGQPSEFKSKWLISESDEYLLFRFDGRDFKIDLRVELDDGSLLSAPQNLSLRELIKDWINEQHYPRNNKLSQMRDRSAKSKLWQVMRQIDMLFLNAKRYAVSRYGFSFISPGDINALRIKFLNCNNAHDALYDWPETLGTFLVEKISGALDYDFDEFVAKRPIFLEPIPENSSRHLPLTDDQIFRARVWLYKNGYYAKREGIQWPGNIKTTKLVRLLYPSCMMAPYMRPLSYELEIQAVYGHVREFPPVPVRQENESATNLRYSAFCQTLLSQTNLPASELRIPDESLNELRTREDQHLLSEVGRYTTLPHFLSINLLNKSVAFFEERADEILSYCSSLLKNAWENKITPEAYFRKYPKVTTSSGHIFHSWNLYATSGKSNHSSMAYRPFEDLRDLKGVIQSYYAVLGSIQYTVGYFTARRQSELINIKFRDIHFDQNYISTLIMKTGISNTRISFDMPVIPIVTKMLARLKRFFQECGIPDKEIEKSSCFSRFSLRRAPGICKANTKRYDCHLDVMSDFFQADVEDGRRFYPRQHQLRRAFAIGFYYLNKKGNLSILSYYYGHMDFKQIYRYITTVIGNKELLDIEAAYLIAETTKDTPASAELLSQLGLDPSDAEIFVHERDKLERYYKACLKDRSIVVEPQFFSVDGNDQFLVSVIVRRPRDGQ